MDAQDDIAVSWHERPYKREPQWKAHHEMWKLQAPPFLAVQAQAGVPVPRNDRGDSEGTSTRAGASVCSCAPCPPTIVLPTTTGYNASRALSERVVMVKLADRLAQSPLFRLCVLPVTLKMKMSSKIQTNGSERRVAQSWSRSAPAGDLLRPTTVIAGLLP